MVSNLSKPRIEYLDLYRAFAILAVLMIHTTSYPVVLSEQGSLAHEIYYLLNSASQFAVPAFLFLSGLVLFYNYYPAGDGWSWVKAFYRKRLLYIVVPYLAWSLFYYLSVQVATESSVLLDLDRFLVKLATGSNYEHLYYFMIIIQFYVLFPALVYFVQRLGPGKWLIPIALLLHVMFFVINHHWLHFQRTGVLFVTYFLQFCAGAYAGMHFECAVRALIRQKRVVATLFAAGTLLYIFAGDIYYRWLPVLQPYKAYLNQLIYFWFTLAASAFLLLLAYRIYSAEAMARVKRALNRIGAASFVIFLSHPFFLAVWRHYVAGDFGPYYHVLTAMGYLIALFGSWGSYILLSRFARYTWWITGEKVHGSRAREEAYRGGGSGSERVESFRSG